MKLYNGLNRITNVILVVQIDLFTVEKLNARISEIERKTHLNFIRTTWNEVGLCAEILFQWFNVHCCWHKYKLELLPHTKHFTNTPYQNVRSNGTFVNFIQDYAPVFWKQSIVGIFFKKHPVCNVNKACTVRGYVFEAKLIANLKKNKQSMMIQTNKPVFRLLTPYLPPLLPPRMMQRPDEVVSRPATSSSECCSSEESKRSVKLEKGWSLLEEWLLICHILLSHKW